MQLNFKVLSARTSLIKIFILLLLCVYIITSGGQYVTAASSDSTIKVNGKSVNISIKDYKEKNSAGFYVFGDSGATITYEIKQPVATEFNRFSLVYSSRNCLKGEIFYELDSKTYSEEFFLEDGNKKTFSSLIDGYLASKKATKISKIVLKDIENIENAFVLHEVTTAVYKVYSDDTIYIENSRFKLGVCLIWGGGLNYFEDKKDGDSSINNMLNYHDAGRLVQQSYYGTGEAPYESTIFNGTTWNYNPVQGGDVSGNKSKLVDFYIDDSRIYVKCRPLDWAHDNKYTISYMENNYVLHDDYVKVDNKFIDFSGYSHGGRRPQELPAFYTISYLDKFTFYNGTKPWTNDTLTNKIGLPFWGGEEADKCKFNIVDGNTETWCSWTSNVTGYGIGLYTPEIEELLAGRNAWNGSKDPMNVATNYVAPLINTSMQNFTAFEYSYLLTGGNISQIRNTFKAHKDDIDQNWDAFTSIDYTHLDFAKESDITAISSRFQTTATNSSTGVVKFEVTGNGDDPSVYIDYQANLQNLSTKDYRYLVYSYMIPTSNSDGHAYESDFFICTEKSGWAPSGAAMFRKELIKDGKYHSMIIDLYDYPDMWPSTDSQIYKIRFDYFTQAVAGDVMYLSEFSLAKDMTTAQKYADNYMSTVAPSTGNNTSLFSTPPTMTFDDKKDDLNPIATAKPSAGNGTTSSATSTPGSTMSNGVEINGDSGNNGNGNANDGNADSGNPNNGNLDNNGNNNVGNNGNTDNNNSGNNVDKNTGSGNNGEVVNGENKGLPTFAIVMIVVGSVLVAGGAGVAIWFFIRKKNAIKE